MFGRVGQDVFGEALVAGMRQEGIDTSGVEVSLGPSGVAIITIDAAGENTIVVASGANNLVDTHDVMHLEGLLDRVQVLLLQLEVPLAMVVAAATAARQRGVMVLLDPAPSQPMPAELYGLADVLTPNESEAAALVGFALSDNGAIQRAAELLHARTKGHVIIKLGGRGAYLYSAAGGQFFPAFSVPVIDTVAAGDAFSGGLAAGLCEGLTLEQAMRWGLATGALAVTKPGAQAAMPTRAEVLALMG
jgi:ribokinase